MSELCCQFLIPCGSLIKSIAEAALRNLPLYLRLVDVRRKLTRIAPRAGVLLFLFLAGLLPLSLLVSHSASHLCENFL